MTPAATLRRLLCACSALVGLCPALIARAQDGPIRPVTLYMGFPVGSGVDVVARRLPEALGKSLGQPVVIDDKPGAAGEIASQFVADAKADGHTMLPDIRCILNQVQTVLANHKAGKVRLPDATTAAPVAAVKEVLTIATSG